MEAEVDHPHLGRLRKGLGCNFESCGRFNVNLQSTQKTIQKQVGRGEKPFSTSASFRWRHQLLQFQILERDPRIPQIFLISMENFFRARSI